MLKINTLLLFLFVSIGVVAQTINREELGTPFDFPLYLSGNFGELRSNHFHAGLDFKTQHQSGKKMLALTDGYISRVQVTHGSGYVLHTVYDNGLSTKNLHLRGFVAPLSALVDSIQYANESWEMDLTLEPNKYRIRRGDHIAWSGNMGYSFGPHLHFELIDTATGDLLDAMPYYQHRLKDTRAPKAESYLFEPLFNQGIINGSTNITIEPIQGASAITAWGVVGVGIKAFDYMDGVNNRYGVRNMQLYVDDELSFESDISRYPPSQSRYINSWTYKNHMKTYLAPANPLKMLRALNHNRGWLAIDEERLYKLRFVLTDYHGNSSTYNLNIRGLKQEIPLEIVEPANLLSWDKINIFSRLGADLVIPPASLYEDNHLDFEVRSGGADLNSLIYQLVSPDRYLPLQQSADLRIRVANPSMLDFSKLYIGKLNRKGEWGSVGGKYEDGFVHAKIRELGTFAVLSDSIPPKVKAINKNNWAKSGEISFLAEDKETGIYSYRGTVDGQYALFYLDIMPKKIRYKLDKSRLVRGKQHKVQLEVVDNAKNRTFIEEEFYW